MRNLCQTPLPKMCEHAIHPSYNRIELRIVKKELQKGNNNFKWTYQQKFKLIHYLKHVLQGNSFILQEKKDEDYITHEHSEDKHDFQSISLYGSRTSHVALFQLYEILRQVPLPSHICLLSTFEEGTNQKKKENQLLGRKTLV